MTELFGNFFPNSGPPSHPQKVFLLKVCVCKYFYRYTSSIPSLLHKHHSRLDIIRCCAITVSAKGGSSLISCCIHPSHPSCPWLFTLLLFLTLTSMIFILLKGEQKLQKSRSKFSKLFLRSPEILQDLGGYIDNT